MECVYPILKHLTYNLFNKQYWLFLKFAVHVSVNVRQSRSKNLKIFFSAYHSFVKYLK